MGHWIPPSFVEVVHEVRKGRQPRVPVRNLVKWFGFDRRGHKVNAYIRDAMQQEGVTCTPALDAVFSDGSLTFSSVIPLRIVAPSPPPLPPMPARERPYPIAVFDSIIAAQADLSRRVLTRLDAIERALAYLVFAQLAALRDHASGRYPDALRRELSGVLPKTAAPGKPISFGTWLDLARRLDRLTPDSNDPVASASHRLFSAMTPESPLAASLESCAVKARNKFHHAATLPASEYADAEPALDSLATQLHAALEPLLNCELVCVHATEVGEREAYRYRLRVLHGAEDFFRTRTLETSDKLTPRWAYLMRPDLAPLRLAPGVLCLEDLATERVCLYFSRTMALDPGQVVDLLSVVGGAKQSVLLPT